MGPLIVLVGIGLLIAGWLLLRLGGTSWRIGRLLAAAPQRSLAEARAMATRGEPTYVRVHGRIDSAEEFPGDDAQALVFRRRRLQYPVPGPLAVIRASARWRSISDERLAVPFGLAERGEGLALDIDALGDGLVVVPRVSDGRAAELPAVDAGDDPGLPPETPVRLRIDQVATTDHATACGVPRLSPSGEATLGPGLGRPLILTTLEVDEAMRVLGADQPARWRVAAGLLVAAPIVVAVGLVLALLGW